MVMTQSSCMEFIFVSKKGGKGKTHIPTSMSNMQVSDLSEYFSCVSRKQTIGNKTNTWNCDILYI